MSIGGISGGSTAPGVLGPDTVSTKGTAASGSGSQSSGSSANSVSIFARADGSITTTETDAKGNVVSSTTTTRATPNGSSGPGAVLDVKA